MASRSLDSLTQEARQKCLAWQLELQNRGISVLVYCTYRSAEEQDALFASGRTTPGPVLTNARGGESSHQKRIAWDAVPLQNGKPLWDDKAKFAVMGEVAERLGIKWAGKWRGKLRETCHFEV